MIWQSAHEFFAMNGYALYVWGAFIVTVGCLFSETLLLSLWRRLVLQYLSALPQPHAASETTRSKVQ